MAVAGGDGLMICACQSNLGRSTYGRDAPPLALGKQLAWERGAGSLQGRLQVDGRTSCSDSLRDVEWMGPSCSMKGPAQALGPGLVAPGPLSVQSIGSQGWFLFLASLMEGLLPWVRRKVEVF